MAITAFLKSQKHHAGRTLSMAVGIGTLAGFLLILQAWCLTEAVNGVIFQDKDLNQVLPWLWAMLGIFLLRAGLAWAADADELQKWLEEQGFMGFRAPGLGINTNKFMKAERLHNDR